MAAVAMLVMTMTMVMMVVPMPMVVMMNMALAVGQQARRATTGRRCGAFLINHRAAAKHAEMHADAAGNNSAYRLTGFGVVRERGIRHALENLETRRCRFRVTLKNLVDVGRHRFRSRVLSHVSRFQGR